MSDNTRTSFLELDDAPVKIQPNANVFTSVDSLQPKDGATAKQDANGNWVNAIGLQSTASHRHVAKVWQDKCLPLDEFIETLNSQSKNKVDIVKPESQVRLKDFNTLVDGMTLTKSGMNSLRLFTPIPSSMISYMDERGHHDDLVRFINEELNLRAKEWHENGKDDRDFRLRIRHDDNGNDIIRAIVSERYGVIDNHEAMQMIVDALPSTKDALASHLFNDGDDMYGNILVPDNMKSEPDSDYGVGIAFRNSEIRNATFKVSPFLFRAICLNGMIWGRQNSEINVNQKHMGNIDRKELAFEVRNAIKVALTQGNDLLTLMGYAKNVKVQEPLSVIAQLCRQKEINMTAEQGRLWHKGYTDSLAESNGHLHDKTAFGIVNGLTRSAQNYSGAKREHMETIAGQILAPAIDADLQAIQKRWGRIADNASSLSEKTVNQYAYVAV
jgi:hypothetical protein